MKKLLLIAITMASMSLAAIEQNQSESFPYEQLLPELKSLVLQAAADAANVPEAIAIFKNLLLTSKQFNTQQASNLFLNALLKKFPDQEVRIARSLNNNFAKNWLNEKRKAQGLPPYTSIKTNRSDVILPPILSGNLAEVKEWLEEGYDPSILLPVAIEFGPPGKSLPLIKLLVSYGANVNSPVELGLIKTGNTHSLLYKVLREKAARAQSFDIYTKHFSEIVDYLIQEGATLNPGEEKLFSQQ